MKKYRYLILVCLISMLMLTGCTTIFDVTNFNRATFPSAESEVDPSLANTQKPKQNALTKAQYSAYIEQTRAAMQGASHETIRYRWNKPRPFYYGGRFYRRIDRFADESKTVGRENLGPVQAYAQFVRRIEQDTFRQLFFEDYFVADACRYEWTDHKEFAHEERDFVQGGSNMLQILAVLGTHFGSGDLDWENGTPVFQIHSTATAKELLPVVQFDPGWIGQTLEDFMQLTATVFLTGLEAPSAATGTGSAYISGVRLNMLFREEQLIIDCIANSLGLETIPYPEDISKFPQKSAVIYHALRSAAERLRPDRPMRATVRKASEQSEFAYSRCRSNGTVQEMIRLSDTKRLYKYFGASMLLQEGETLRSVNRDDPEYPYYESLFSFEAAEIDALARAENLVVKVTKGGATIGIGAETDGTRWRLTLDRLDGTLLSFECTDIEDQVQSVDIFYAYGYECEFEIPPFWG